MSFGKYTYGTPNIRWQNNNAKLVIGNFCSIAGNVNIYLGYIFRRKSYGRLGYHISIWKRQS